jgi:alpha-beta hydrolase superfamily lysophospholipase
VQIDGARHEIFHETDAIRSRFWDAFDRFTEIG